MVYVIVLLYRIDVEYDGTLVQWFAYLKPMITRVQAKNFRSFGEIDVQLGPLNVLVGRNGAGKSAFIDILRFVRDGIRMGLESAIDHRHGITAVRRWAPTKPYNVEIGVTVETRNFWAEYFFIISSGKLGTYRVSRETCSVGKTVGEADETFDIKAGKWLEIPKRLESRATRTRVADDTTLALPSIALFSPLLSRLRHTLGGNVFYTIFPNTLRVPQKPSNDKQLLEHGENFAAIIRRLIKNKGTYNKLLRALGRVVDGVDNVRVRQVGGFLVTELRHEDLNGTPQDKKAAWFDLDQESDGTLRLLGMLVALYQSRINLDTVALEEPENALHPGALAVLTDVLFEVARRNQIIVTTQSPDLISRFGVEQLLVVERERGVSAIGPIDDMQRAAVEEQLFTSGDLLRIEGLRRQTIDNANSYAQDRAYR